MKFGETFTTFAFAGLLFAGGSQLRAAPASTPVSRLDRLSSLAMSSLANMQYGQAIRSFSEGAELAKQTGDLPRAQRSERPRRQLPHCLSIPQGAKRVRRGP